jgi:hypothetical protein
VKFRFNRKRVTGEEWLVRQTGAYLPGVYEEVRNKIRVILTRISVTQLKLLFVPMHKLLPPILLVILLCFRRLGGQSRKCVHLDLRFWFTSQGHEKLCGCIRQEKVIVS